MKLDKSARSNSVLREIRTLFSEIANRENDMTTASGKVIRFASVFAAGLCSGALLVATPAAARNMVALIVNGSVVATAPATTQGVAPKGKKVTKYNATITGFNVPTGIVGELEYDPATCEEVS